MSSKKTFAWTWCNNNPITCLQPRVCSHKCYGLLCKTWRNTGSHLVVNNSRKGVLVCSTPACRRRAILEMILHISSEACVTDLHQITSVSSHIPRSPRPADRNPGRDGSLFQSFKMKKKKKSRLKSESDETLGAGIGTSAPLKRAAWRALALSLSFLSQSRRGGNTSCCLFRNSPPRTIPPRPSTSEEISECAIFHRKSTRRRKKNVLFLRIGPVWKAF